MGDGDPVFADGMAHHVHGDAVDGLEGIAGHQLRRGALGQQASAGQDADPVAELLGQVQQVSGQVGQQMAAGDVIMVIEEAEAE